MYVWGGRLGYGVSACVCVGGGGVRGKGVFECLCEGEGECSWMNMYVSVRVGV